MADNRQLSYVLTLAGGIASVALSLLGAFGGAMMASYGMGWMHGGGFSGMSGDFRDVFLAFAIGQLLVGIAIGVLLLVAAPKLRDGDADARRTWGVTAAIAGGVGLVAGSFVGGILGLVGGILALTDASRPEGASR